MNFSYSQVLEFKRILDEKFGVYLHFHDACGGQYFSFDEAEKDEVYSILPLILQISAVKLILPTIN